MVLIGTGKRKTRKMGQGVPTGTGKMRQLFPVGEFFWGGGGVGKGREFQVSPGKLWFIN